MVAEKLDKNYDNIEYTEPKKFNEYIKSKIKDKEKYYLFFDEIQDVTDFERVINSFRATMNVSIFITGYNGKYRWHSILKFNYKFI